MTISVWFLVPFLVVSIIAVKLATRYKGIMNHLLDIIGELVEENEDMRTDIIKKKTTIKTLTEHNISLIETNKEKERP